MENWAFRGGLDKASDATTVFMSNGSHSGFSILNFPNALKYLYLFYSSDIEYPCEIHYH